MPEAHVVLATLGNVDLDAVGIVQAQRGAVGLVDVRGAELLGEDVDHPEDVGVFEHARVDDRGLVMGQHDILAVDRHELTERRLCGLVPAFVGLCLVHLVSLLGWAPFFTASSTPLTMPS